MIVMQCITSGHSDLWPQLKPWCCSQQSCNLLGSFYFSDQKCCWQQSCNQPSETFFLRAFFSFWGSKILLKAKQNFFKNKEKIDFFYFQVKHVADNLFSVLRDFHAKLLSLEAITSFGTLDNSPAMATWKDHITHNWPLKRGQMTISVSVWRWYSTGQQAADKGGAKLDITPHSLNGFIFNCKADSMGWSGAGAGLPWHCALFNLLPHCPTLCSEHWRWKGSVLYSNRQLFLGNSLSDQWSMKGRVHR